MSTYVKVSKLTYEDLIYNNAINNTTNDAEEPEKEYDKMPQFFEGLDNWPKNTNLKCSYCSLKIPGILLFIPSSIDPYNGSIGTGPSVCNFKCMIKSIESCSIQDYNNKLIMVRILHKRITGFDLESDTTNINKNELAKFGGVYSKKEFMKKIYDEYNNKKIYIKLFATKAEATNFIDYIEEIQKY